MSIEYVSTQALRAGDSAGIFAVRKNRENGSAVSNPWYVRAFMKIKWSEAKKRLRSLESPSSPDNDIAGHGRRDQVD